MYYINDEEMTRIFCFDSQQKLSSFIWMESEMLLHTCSVQCLCTLRAEVSGFLMAKNIGRTQLQPLNPA